MNTKKSIVIFLSALIIFTVLIIVFWNNQKEDNTKPSNEELLTLKGVLEKYIQNDMNSNIIGREVVDNYYSTFPATKKISFFDVQAEVIKKYGILDTSFSKEDKNIAFINVNYYCDKIILSKSTGLKDEIPIAKIDGYPPLFTITCSDFFKSNNAAEINKNQLITSNAFTFDAKTNIETVHFQLLKDNEVWKVIGPQMIPHISENNFDSFFREFTTKAEVAEILSPRDVVEKYIEGELLGAYLDGPIGKNAPDIKQYYTYADGHFSENFIRLDTHYLEIIKNYQIISERQLKNDSYHIGVNFSCDRIVSLEYEFPEIKSKKIRGGTSTKAPLVEMNCSDFFKYYYDNQNQLGNKSTNPMFDFSNNIETIDFELARDGQAWKLNGPGTQPHISEDTLVKYLKQ